MCHPSAIFASELSYEPFFFGGGGRKKPNPILICIYNSMFNFSLKNSCILLRCGVEQAVYQQELFSNLHLYSYTASCHDCRECLY